MAYSQSQQEMFKPYEYGSRGMQAQKPRSWAGKWALGDQESYQRSPTQTPQGMDLLSLLMQLSGQGLQNPQAGFEPIEQQARSGFAQQTIPGLAERFTSMGGHGSAALSSPAFASQLGQAGAGLEENLAGMKAQYGLENRRGLLDQARLGLTPQFETQHKARTSGAIENTIDTLMKTLGGAGSEYGKQMGSWAGKKSFGDQSGSDERMGKFEQFMKLFF